MSVYTNIPKPTGTGYTNISKPTDGGSTLIVAGMATGLLTPPTYATAHTITSSKYTNVLKPSGYSYTSVAKPIT